MKFVDLNRKDGQAYIDTIVKNGCGPNFVKNRWKLFRQMIKDQGVKFWFRFWLTFCLQSDVIEIEDFTNHLPLATTSLSQFYHHRFVQGTRKIENVEKLKTFTLTLVSAREAINFSWNIIFDDRANPLSTLQENSSEIQFIDEIYQYVQVNFACAVCEVFYKWLQAEDGYVRDQKYWTVPGEYLDADFQPGRLEIYMTKQWGRNLPNLFGVKLEQVPWIRKCLRGKGAFWGDEEENMPPLTNTDCLKAKLVSKYLKNWQLKVKKLKTILVKVDEKKLKQQQDNNRRICGVINLIQGKHSQTIFTSVKTKETKPTAENVAQTPFKRVQDSATNTPSNLSERIQTSTATMSKVYIEYKTNKKKKTAHKLTNTVNSIEEVPSTGKVVYTSSVPAIDFKNRIHKVIDSCNIYDTHPKPLPTNNHFTTSESSVVKHESTDYTDDIPSHDCTSTDESFRKRKLSNIRCNNCKGRKLVKNNHFRIQAYPNIHSGNLKIRKSFSKIRTIANTDKKSGLDDNQLKTHKSTKKIVKLSESTIKPQKTAHTEDFFDNDHKNTTVNILCTDSEDCDVLLNAKDKLNNQITDLVNDIHKITDTIDTIYTDKSTNTIKRVIYKSHKCTSTIDNAHTLPGFSDLSDKSTNTIETKFVNKLTNTHKKIFVDNATLTDRKNDRYFHVDDINSESTLSGLFKKSTNDFGISGEIVYSQSTNCKSTNTTCTLFDSNTREISCNTSSCVLTSSWTDTKQDHPERDNATSTDVQFSQKETNTEIIQCVKQTNTHESNQFGSIDPVQIPQVCTRCTSFESNDLKLVEKHPETGCLKVNAFKYKSNLYKSRKKYNTNTPKKFNYTEDNQCNLITSCCAPSVIDPVSNDYLEHTCTNNSNTIISNHTKSPLSDIDNLKHNEFSEKTGSSFILKSNNSMCEEYNTIEKLKSIIEKLNMKIEKSEALGVNNFSPSAKSDFLRPTPDYKAIEITGVINSKVTLPKKTDMEDFSYVAPEHSVPNFPKKANAELIHKTKHHDHPSRIPKSISKLRYLGGSNNGSVKSNLCTKNRTLYTCRDEKPEKLGIIKPKKSEKFKNSFSALREQEEIDESTDLKKLTQRQCACCLNKYGKLQKKCQQCVDEKWPNPRYYCGIFCQIKHWLQIHQREHGII